jgi:hypothetical protein
MAEPIANQIGGSIRRDHPRRERPRRSRPLRPVGFSGPPSSMPYAGAIDAMRVRLELGRFERQLIIGGLDSMSGGALRCAQHASNTESESSALLRAFLRPSLAPRQRGLRSDRFLTTCRLHGSGRHPYCGQARIGRARQTALGLLTSRPAPRCAAARRPGSSSK